MIRTAHSIRPAPGSASTSGLARHWLAAFNVIGGAWTLTPWLVPALMAVGATGLARVGYLFYGLQCHQLAERSYFLFGDQLMYSITQIAAVTGSSDPLSLRDFVGNASMGYKVAWSDRMVSLYTSLWLAGVAYAISRRRIRPLPIFWLAVLLLPLAVDGGTHLISDLSGIGQGFRDSNNWLRALSGNSWPEWVYSGDGLGSFNWMMRLFSGVLAGLGAGLAVVPRLDEAFGFAGRDLESPAPRNG
ncbi:MAG: DUF2085 domain-containing protein [Thermoflexales bacterium]